MALMPEGERVLEERRHPLANCRVILASCSDIVYQARSERTDMNE